MNDIKKMLELRSKLKKKKPDFIRQDFQIKKLKTKWVKAKGIHSKMRRKMAGHINMPHPGYGSPNIVKGMNQQGLREIIVHNTQGLSTINPGFCAVISRGVGNRKRLEIVKKASELGIKVANVADNDAFIRNVDDIMKKRKEDRNKLKGKKIASAKSKEDKKTTKDDEKEIKRKVLEKKV